MFNVLVSDLEEGLEDGYVKFVKEVKMRIIEESIRIDNIWRY